MSKSISKTAVWILMALLILGLGGFGVTNLGGGIRSIGSVGDTEISVNDYARVLQNEIRALEAQTGEPMSLPKAREMGIDAAALSQLVTTAALDEEVSSMGLSIGDESLLSRMSEISAFQGPDGSFDRQAYEFSLDRAGVTQSEFEEDLRNEAVRTLLQGAVVGGVTTPAGYADTMVRFLTEERKISWARLDTSHLEAPIADPDDAALTTYHTENAGLYATPEIKKITYVWLTPDMILDTVEVDETLLRETYDDRIDEFVKPERRLVERLAFGDTAEADAAKARIDAGEVSFEDLVANRGLTLADIDLGDVTQEELGSAGTDIFADDEGAVLGPYDSAVGPVLYRVNGVIYAQSTSFEDATEELRAELATDRARRVIDGKFDEIEVLLAGGATLEEVANETDMVLGQIDWHPEAEDDIAGYEAFRTAASAVQSEDYPVTKTFEEGGLFALRLDDLVPSGTQPLDEVRDQVAADWRADETVKALQARFDAALAAGDTLETLGAEVEVVPSLTRQGFVPEVPPGFIDTAFGAEPGEMVSLEGDGALFVLRTDDILPAQTDSAEQQSLRQRFVSQAATSASQDMLQAVIDDIRGRAGLTLDQTAINAVHANFQ